jgi:hypothetical protein
VILLSTLVFELLEICTVCLGMLLGLSHLRMVGWGGIYSPQPPNLPLDRKQQLSVVGRTGQSGAPPERLCSVWYTPRQPTVGVCSSRPLDPIVTDCPVHTGQSGATARGRLFAAPLRRLSGCPTGQSGAHRTGPVYCPVRHQALADSPLLGFLR